MERRISGGQIMFNHLEIQKSQLYKITTLRGMDKDLKSRNLT